MCKPEKGEVLQWKLRGVHFMSLSTAHPEAAPCRDSMALWGFLEPSCVMPSPRHPQSPWSFARLKALGEQRDALLAIEGRATFPKSQDYEDKDKVKI